MEQGRGWENRCQFIFPLPPALGERTAMPRSPQVIDGGLIYHAINPGNNRSLSGRPFASAVWQQRMAVQQGMALATRLRGRPRKQAAKMN